MLTEACGAPDGALSRVAAQLAAGAADRGADVDHVVGLLRASGEPHVRPRVVRTVGKPHVDVEAVRGRLAELRRETTRCGVAFATTSTGEEVMAAVALEALADLEALPMRARTGEWLTLAASLRTPARSAKVVLLGPRGQPRTVPTAVEPSGRVHARFALDRPGAFVVQLVGELEGGPQPLLEARVFADVEPDDDAAKATPAPGEDAGVDEDDAERLGQMVAALRRSESLAPLRRDRELDELAREHAAKMRDRGLIAHDLGDGDVVTRLEAAGITASVVGENVARARSVALAHRALHESPSHRLNLLHARYTHVGIGVAKDPAGVVYACQIFAGRRP
jgi:hypothetical protein